jgi:hypothetical protein
VSLSSLNNVYIVVCTDTQIRMRIVTRILTLVQSGITPLQIAEEQGHASIATLIRNAGSLKSAPASSANAAAKVVYTHPPPPPHPPLSLSVCMYVYIYTLSFYIIYIYVYIYIYIYIYMCN